ncbi:MAG: CpsD/CapB family tyrosine-protein kinase [Myxococcales bacterium]|nr:CpsD/CapB family tyrosine-protein kinase [Myxococcales bacterium]
MAEEQGNVAQNKNPSRPASTRDVAGGAGGGDDASYESFVLGPDLGPSANVQAGQHQSAQHVGGQQQQAAPMQASASAQHGLNPQKTMLAADELVPQLDDLPPEFASRTLIASARMGPTAQRKGGNDAAVAAGGSEVQISAREASAQLGDPRLVMLHEPDSTRAATFRVLRHRLAERGNPRTILVSSAEQGEGKTTVAVNLALALSECGRARVLLVEANLRRPSLAKVLGFRPPLCFGEQLQVHKDKPTEPWMVAQVASPWMHVVAVDHTTFKKPNVIDGPAFENALDQLKRVQYDYLVLDAPQVLGNADVNLLQDCSDAVLLTCLARTTSRKVLRSAMSQLTTAKLVGVAILEV